MVDYQSCTKNYNCALGCTKTYMKRYGRFCTGHYPITCEEMARIHNGGPYGCQRAATLGYWNAVKNCLKKFG